MCQNPVGVGCGARIPVLHFVGVSPLQVGVGKCGVFLSHRAETLDGVHQVFFHVLKSGPVISGQFNVKRTQYFVTG